MKLYLLSVVAMLVGISLHGQSAKAYPDMESFKNGKPVVIDHVIISKRTKSDMRRHGGGIYIVESNHAATSKKLQKEYWAVELDSMLLVNTARLIQSRWYAPVQYRSRNFLFFSIAGDRTSAAAAGGAFGLIGGAIAKAAYAGDTSHYLTALNWSETIPLNKRSFAWYLKEKEDTLLMRRYKEEEEPTDTATYFKYLRLMEK